MSGPAVRLPADSSDRDAAVTDFDANLCVSAGAGSGKTSLLIERILFALLVRGVAPDRIVALTFTEKAAAEMRARLREALEQVRRLHGGDGEAGRLLARLAALPARSRPDPGLVQKRVTAALEADETLATIHSFALHLLHRHPIEAALPAGVAMDLGEGFRRHAEEELPLLLERTLPDPQQGAALTAVLQRLTLEEFEQLAESLAWMPERAWLVDADPLAPIRPRLAELERELAAARPHLVLESERQKKLREQWDGLLAGLRHLREQGLSPSGRCEFPAATSEAIQRELSSVRPVQEKFDIELCVLRLEETRRLFKQLSRVDEGFVRTLLAAIGPLARSLAASFVRRGFVTAEGALVRAAELLERNPGVRRLEAARIDLLLVDEFQDTDPLQCEIALYLCEEPGAPAATRAEEVKLARGKLFLVGDPKQSIYRFRGADLDVYACTTRQVLEQGGRALELTTSFRSPPELVEPLNAIFRPWMDATTDAEPPYVGLTAHRARGEGGAALQVWTVVRPDGAADAQARREAEGRAIAQGIVELRQRGIAFGQIVLLLRSLTSLRHYVQPLRDARIPFVLAGGSTFVQRSEVGELLSLLLAAADPSDEVAALGALRATALAVPDRALAAAKRRHGSLLWPGLLGDADPVVDAAARRLAAFHADLDRHPVALAIERFVEGGVVLPIAALARDGDQRIANLRKLATMAATRAQATRQPLAEVVRELNDRHTRVEGDSESSLADEDVDAVRILTIHKAKGLEFDVVFVGDLAARSTGSRKGRPTVARVALADGVRLAVEVPALRVGNVAQVLRAERDRLHETAESKRLFYVAATRAKERLIFVAAPVGSQDAPGEKKGVPPWVAPLGAIGFPPDADRPDGVLDHPDVVHRRIAAPERTLETHAPGPSELEPLIAATRALAAAAAAARAPGLRFERPSGQEVVALEPVRRMTAVPARDADISRVVGIACHVALARSGPARAPDAAAIACAVAVAAADATFDLERVTQEVTALLHSPAAAALFASLAPSKVHAAELPLTLAQEGRLWRGTADLLIEEAGRLIVADWKSDREADAEELARRYRPQLVIYRDALQRALSLPDAPGMELLLLRHGRRLAL